MKRTLLFIILLFSLYTSKATIFTVNTTSDATTGAGTSGSLRWCIGQANGTPAKDTINFGISGTFTVASNYPVISNPLYINGFSAAGSVQAQLGTGARVLKVILNGPGNSTVYGFQITASNCEISGLVIQNFFRGIYIDGGDNNWIWGCYIGTSSNGLTISASTTCYDDGITLFNSANNNIIGTNGDGSNDAYEGNLISGNGDGGQFRGEGVSINETLTGTAGAIGTNCSGNRVAGNYLGTNETGTAALYTMGSSGTQRGSGVQINYSTANIIGTNADGTSDVLERNLISGNTDCGVVIIGGSGNKIKGNYIGTTKTGLVGLPNYVDGGVNISATEISIKSGANNNFIGTDGDGTNDNIEGNIIGSITFAGGGNGLTYNYGIFISASTGNRIAGNNIGIGSDGVAALNIKTTSGDYIDKGIYIASSSASTIVGTNGDGTSDAFEHNYIGNTGSGVTIDISNSCIVAGNYFGLGTNLTTTEAFSSTCVYILNSQSSRIGSSALNTLEKNYICNSANYGILVDGAGTASNDLNNIRFNTVGIRPDNAPAANAINGIYLQTYSNANTIQYNTVSQNGTSTADGTYSGVRIETNSNTINNNTIFKNVGRGLDILVISTPTATNNLVTQNSIYNNGSSSDPTAKYRVGIDLGWDGTTANDNKDPDTGPNDYTNFPVITGAIPGGSSCTEQIAGTLNALPNTSYYVELFASDVCNGDTAGTNNYLTAGYNYGEGKTYLGASSVFTTNGGGNGSWTFTVPISSVVGQYITATSIQTTGAGVNNTSEYSQCYYVTYDCGDAPDTYHTLMSNCGPVHIGVNTNLKIGTSITADLDGQPSAKANLDIDDGLLTLPTLTVKSTTYTLPNIPVTNTTGSSATLYAWIDFNRNGLFESTEFTSVAVANNATTATLTWNLSTFMCGTTLVTGISYLRMRLTTDALTDVAGTVTVDERSYGIASNGEVEDYKLYIAGYDYGDLSATYPVATALSLEDTATAKVWGGATKPTTECIQHYSIDAMGDGAEEDGLTTAIGAPGTTFNWVIKLNANQANKTVYYGLWIDWDGNGNFVSALDRFYNGSAVVNGLTNVSVPVITPFGVSNPVFRLIISDAPLTSTMYNATIANGEVEDWTLLRILNAPDNILTGMKQNSFNTLKWKSQASQTTRNYILERSNDNLLWKEISSEIVGANVASLYSYKDEHPEKENYYRVKIVSIDNTIQYSNIVPLFGNIPEQTITIYPNPATNTLFVQNHNNQYETITIVDMTGRVIMSYPLSAVTTTVDISLLEAGTYILKFTNKNGEQRTEKLVKN